MPRTQRSAIRLYRGALLSRGPAARGEDVAGPGSAEQRCTLHRVRDTRGVETHSRGSVSPGFCNFVAPSWLEGAGKAGRWLRPQAPCATGSKERTRV